MANKNLEDYLQLPYKIEIYRDDDPDTPGWVANVPDLPGCFTQASIFNELEIMIEDAKRAWLETALERGIHIPEPRSEDEFSGKFVVRVPRSLHRKLVDLAENEGVSLNQFINVALAEATSMSYKQLINQPSPELLSDINTMISKALSLNAHEEKTNYGDQQIYEKTGNLITKFRQAFGEDNFYAARNYLIAIKKELSVMPNITPIIDLLVSNWISDIYTLEKEKLNKIPPYPQYAVRKNDTPEYELYLATGGIEGGEFESTTMDELSSKVNKKK